MTKIEQKNIATSLTSTVFLVIAITGVLMYFHILDQYTKELHEIIGLVFVVASLAHVFYNWNSMKSYFSKKVFLVALGGMFIVSLGFILNAKEGENPKTKIINLVLNAPIEKSVSLLGSDINTMEAKLKNAGIKFNNEGSIEEISKNNKTSPFRIIDIITTK